MPLKLMYITNDAAVAKIAEKAGADRIIIDLETLGKQERQGHLDSVKSDHSAEDIKTVKPCLHRSELMVRVNPLNPASEDEINKVIDYGADIVMLPMFKTADEAEKFAGFVNGRAKTMLLLETAEAEYGIDSILEVSGIDEIHIGLNDLHLAHKMKFMFELLADGTVEKLCRKIAGKGIPYGFGGVSAIGSGMLPAECILAEHYRLGSSMVILSRSFCDVQKIKDSEKIKAVFNSGIREIREFEEFLLRQNETYFSENLKEVKRIVLQTELGRKDGT